MSICCGAHSLFVTGAQGASAEVAEEGAFADVVAELMQEQYDSTVAVQRFANICQDNAAILR